MIELLSTAEMGEADRRTIAGGVPGTTLMENAGRAVAALVATRHPPGSRIAVVAGPGNNGGDGFVAARMLAERGHRVRVLLVGGRDRLRGDAALAAQRWQGPTEAAEPAALLPADAVIDALFGAGLDRPVGGRAACHDRGDEWRPARLRGRPAERDQRHDRRGDGGCGQRRRDRDVLPPQDRPSVAARPAPLRNGSRRRHRDPGRRADADRAAHVRQCAGTLGWRVSGSAPRRAQICARPCGRGVRRRSPRPGRRGWRRAGRCGRGPASSPSRARARRSRSTRPPTLPSWSARSMGHESSANFSPMRGATRWCWGPEAA